MSMNLKAALAIVHDLAKQNALDITTCDPEQVTHAARQKEALDIVETAFLTSLNGNPLYNGTYVRPFQTTGEMKTPLNAICWPSQYMTITDARSVTVMVVPAVIEPGDTPDTKVVNKEKTLALTLSILTTLNTSGPKTR